MKVLDVSPFHDGLRGNLAMLSRLESEMRAIETAVEGLVAMDESLKGHGGDSIRAFYKNCHLPHLQFFMTFKSSFESTLARMDSALDALESDASNGFIRESFLEGKVEDGLTEISQLTSNLTDEANSIMDQVSDIVALPHLNDSGVQEGVQAARKKRDQTVVDLNEFDANQKMALVTIENDLVTMAKWVSDIEGLFTQGVTDINFPMDRWAALSSKNTLKTDLVHRTAETAGIAGMTDMNDQLVTSFGVDVAGGDSVMKGQGFGDDGPGGLSGMEAHAFPSMTAQAQPFHESGISGAATLASGAAITSRRKEMSGKVTSTKTAPVGKKKKQNKVFGFLKGVADFVILDDMKTIADPNASLIAKGFAIFAVTPAGKGLKAANLGFKLVRKSPVAKWTKDIQKKIDIELKYKGNWTKKQRIEADAKVKALSDAPTVKTQPQRVGTSASARYKKANGPNSVPSRNDVDHTIDLQLGGADDILNMKPLDLSVNRSLGTQIQHKIKDYPDKTPFGKFTIKDRSD